MSARNTYRGRAPKSMGKTAARVLGLLRQFYPVMLPAVAICILVQCVVQAAPNIFMERCLTVVGEFWEKNAESRAGLMAQNATGESAEAVEARLLALVKEWFGDEVILAGNSIHQDRKFIDREWPRLAAKLHYRMLDVSAWKVYFEGAMGKKFMKREAHRALDDIQGSIDELKWYLGFLKEEK